MISNEQFDELVTPHIDSMHRVATAVTRDANDSQDVVQIALIKAYTKFNTYDKKRGELGNWLRAIVYFSAIDFVRSKRIHHSYNENISTEYENIEQRIYSNGIEIAFSSLPIKYQIVIGCLAKGLTNKEIAMRFGISYNAATVMIHRARKEFREKLQGQDIQL